VRPIVESLRKRARGKIKEQDKIERKMAVVE
jgi:hypothetical protein